MALSRARPSSERWADPAWPITPPDPARAVVAYGERADELVVGFAGPPGGVVVPLAPPASGVAVLVDPETGAVVGAQVDNLRFAAAARWPAWRRLSAPERPLGVVAAFIVDVHDLFARHGIAE